MNLYLILWFLGGGVVSLLNILLLVSSVRRMSPDTRVRSVFLVLSGFLLRYVLVTGVLALAVLQGLGPLFASGAGFLAARWIGVFAVTTGCTSWPALKLWWG